jgi:hypothetical protein
MYRKKILILPKLCDRKGDISKKWFVELVVSQIVWLIISINSGFVIKFFNIHSNNIVMYLFIL